MSKAIIITFLAVILVLPLPAETFIVAVHGQENTETYERIRLWLDLLEKETELFFKMESMSFDRAKEQLLAGKVDMDFARSAPAYTPGSALYLEPPLSHLNYYIYTAEDNWNSFTLNDLKERNVAILSGYLALKQWAESGNLNHIIYTKNQESALLALLYGRASFIVDSLSLTSLVNSDKKYSSLIHRQETPVYSAPLYIVLSKQRESWAPLLSKGMKALDKSGQGRLILPR